jgi:hypothetical protein
MTRRHLLGFIPTLDEIIPASLTVSGGPSARQPFRLCFIGEKSSLGPVLRPLAKEFHAELLVGTGDASDTRVYEIAKHAAADGRVLVVFYFADFDPNGYGMPRAVSRKLQAIRDMMFPDLQFIVHRVGLTKDQCVDLELPSTPLKQKKPNSSWEKRKARWIARWGREQTEIDALAALKPGELERMTREAVRPYFDPSLDRRVEEATQLPEKYAAWFKALPAYQTAIDEITPKHEALSKAFTDFATAQKRAFAALSKTVEDADDAPEFDQVEIEPEVSPDDAPPPLFTTEDDFFTATRKLRDDKSGDDDAEGCADWEEC